MQQLNKASKKTPKNADAAAAVAPETSAAAEVKAKPRVSRSSKTKKSEGQEMTSGKNLHKSAAPVLAELAASEEPRLAPEVEATKAAVDRHAVASLAHSYWVARGHTHGFAEEDWLQAEKELATAASK